MKLRDMDACELVGEISRCRSVAERHRGYVDTDPDHAAGWARSADRHARRAEKLTAAARASTDPELPRFLALFAVEL